MLNWNLWHGCEKVSEGCQHCYVYRIDEMYGRDSRVITKNQDFDLPIRCNRDGSYKVPAGQVVYTCFSSDFLLQQADKWRAQAWEMIKARSDLMFIFATKRIHRFLDCIPDDWGDGYPNVSVYCTVENQRQAHERLAIFCNLPICHKSIICEPLLEQIDLSLFLTSQIERVLVGGESGPGARVCKYDWVLDIRRQCIDRRVSFQFRQTGARFQKDGRIFDIARKLQSLQAQKANIDYDAESEY